MVAMAADQFVNVTYRGLDIGKRLRISQFGPTSAYLEHSTPMPVGTELAIHTDEGVRVPVRVLRVQEQVAGAENPPGMRVAATRLDDHARSWWQDLITTSDPPIPEPVSGAVAQDEEIPADGDEAADAGFQAGADSDEAADAGFQAGAEADDAEAEADASSAEAGADASSAEADGAEAEPESDAETDALDDSDDAYSDDDDAYSDDDDVQEGASREGSRTEQMSAVEIQAIMATARSTSSDTADDEPPAEHGAASTTPDDEDSPSGSKKRRRGRRRRGRG
jgi:hypothetical protein